MLIALIAIIVIYIIVDVNGYNKSSYKAKTNSSYAKVKFNKGFNGEYLTHQILERLPGHKHLLVNTYIPKKNGETTEVDLIMIHETGIYCFESKNYSGWIFGDERSQYWTQTLKGGQKNRFFNPILQNEGHIKHLKELLGDAYNGAYYSVIVFSKRCELKKVKVNSTDILVVRRPFLKYHLSKRVTKREKILTMDNVNALNTLLCGYTDVSETVKQLHVEQIRVRKKVI